MPASEILTRDVRTGGAVGYTEHAVECSSVNAPWRDLVRLERSRKALPKSELTTLWSLVGIIRNEGGMLEQRVNGHHLQLVALHEGYVFTYPQGASIRVELSGPVELTSVQIAPSLLSAVADELGRSAKILPSWRPRDEPVERLATLFELELRSGCAGGRLYGEYLAYALAAYLVQRSSETADAISPGAGGLRNGKLSAALQYIEANAMQDISIADVAEVVHLSPYHFSRLFKHTTGVTPHQYVLHWRISEAKRLLRHSRLDLAEVAQQLGFRDQSHFTSRFRKMTGVTPKRWRESA